MTGVLLALRPSWCELIVAGSKTLECRKSSPRLRLPFKVYIYETKAQWAFDLLEWLGWKVFTERLRQGRGKIVGEFVCNRISCANPPFTSLSESILKASCLTAEQIEKYSAGKEIFFCHITQLKIYDKPRPLTNFHRPCPESLYCESCAMHNEHPVPFCGNYALEIKRPPQSWCYAEDQT